MTVELAPTAGVGRQSLYERVGHQLDGLAALLGLHSTRALIARSHELLCKESADYPAAQRPPRRSTLNADGTPVQLALTLGAAGVRLQFLSDVGAPELSSSQRLAVGRAGLRELAELIGAQGALARIEQLVERMAPSRNPDLLAEPAGAFWIGARFAPGRDPKLKIYINAKWGEDGDRWARLADCAEQLDAGHAWRAVQELVVEELHPLGVALGAGADGAIAGRIYLSGYGRDWGYLEALGAACGGGAFAQRLRRCGRTLLGEDYGYPTRSVVCSLGLRGGRLADIKVELCGHCAFGSDLQARARCLQWLRDDEHAAAVYTRVVELLAGGSLSPSQVTLHSYLGVGSGHDRAFYFNPAATRTPDDGA